MKLKTCLRLTFSILVMLVIIPVQAIEVGVATVDITPPDGVQLWGYASRTQPSTGVLDPLMAKTVVFDDGNSLAALVILDLGRTPPERQLEELRRTLQEKLNLTQSLIAATHTHAAPYFGASEMTDAWMNDMQKKIVQAVEEAIQSKKEARFEIASGAVDITYDRRIVNPDGTIKMLWSNFEREPTTPVDQELHAVYVKDTEGNPIATLVHYACHPVMSGPRNMKVTADFSAFLASHVEEKLGGTCVYLQGACGNINPYLAAILSESEDGYEQMKQDGIRVGEEVVRIADQAQPVEEDDYTIYSRNERIRFGLRYPLEDERTQNLLKGLYSKDWIAEFSEKEKHELEAETSILMLGDTLAWVGFPGEFFDEFQKDLRRRSPVPHTFFVGYCNGYLSYFPTIPIAAEGGYGASYGLLLQTGAGEQMLDRAIVNLYTLSGKLEGR